jgi:hypothetical protein
MNLSQLQKINAISAELLGAKPINEAFHPKDREAKDDIRANCGHHYQMRDKHTNISSTLSKDKDIMQNDLALIAHDYAIKHYNNLGGNHIGGIPEDYHQDRDWYDKLNKMVSLRADNKSKDCGVSCETK